MASQRDWPPLGVGAHLTSDDGACLMELVSLAAEEPFGDRPSCTHPLLSHLARRVNDATSDRRRSELTIFIPALVAAKTLDASSFAGIAAACTRVALERKPSILLQILHASAVRRSRPTDMGRHWLYIHGAAYRSVDLAVFAVVGLPTVEADQALRLILSKSLEALQGRQALEAPEALEAVEAVDPSDPAHHRTAASRHAQPADPAIGEQAGR